MHWTDAMLAMMTEDSSGVGPQAEDALKAPARERRQKIGAGQWAVFLGIAATVVILDQASKRFIDRSLELYQSWPSETWPVRIVRETNTGAAFSILQDQTVFLTVTSLIGLAAILLFFFYPPFDHPMLCVALGLMLGGAIGNLIDRVVLGSVTDFIQFPHYPAFNVADSCIVIGVLILVWFLVFRDDRGRQQAQ
jgi:signal peptidase II